MIRGPRKKEYSTGSPPNWFFLAMNDINAGLLPDGIGLTSLSASMFASSGPNAIPNMNNRAWVAMVASIDSVYAMPGYAGGTVDIFKINAAGTVQTLPGTTSPGTPEYKTAVFIEEQSKIIAIADNASRNMILDTTTDSVIYGTHAPLANLTSITNMIRLQDNRVVRIGLFSSPTRVSLIEVDAVTFTQTEIPFPGVINGIDQNTLENTQSSGYFASQLGPSPVEYNAKLYFTTNNGFAWLDMVSNTFVFYDMDLLGANVNIARPMAITANGKLYAMLSAAANISAPRALSLDLNNPFVNVTPTLSLPQYVEGSPIALSTSISAVENFSDVVLGPDGNLYAVPAVQYADYIFAINPYTEAHNKYSTFTAGAPEYVGSGCVHPDGRMFFAPRRMRQVPYITGLPARWPPPPTPTWASNRVINHM